MEHKHEPIYDKGVLEYFERVLEEELKRIHPEIEVKVWFPNIVATIPGNSILKWLKERLDKEIESSRIVEIENIEWAPDGLRIYLRLKMERAV